MPDLEARERMRKHRERPEVRLREAAYIAALRRLKARHEVEFEMLYAAERGQRGV